MIRISHLKEFVVFSKHINFSAAARELYITQPTLSRHIAELESHFGCSLTVRDGTPHLTRQGQLLLDAARTMVEAYDGVVESIEFSLKEENGLIRIEEGDDNPAFFRHYRKASRILKERKPGIQLKFVQHPRGLTQFEALEKNLIDIAFVHRFGPKHEKFVFDERFRSVQHEKLTHRLGFAMSPTNPLAGKDAVSIVDLKGEPFLVIDNAAFLDWRKAFTLFCREFGFTPKFHLRHADTYSEFYAEPLGDAVFPNVKAGGNAISRFEEAVAVDLKEECYLHFIVLSRSNQSELLREFLDILENVLDA